MRASEALLLNSHLFPQCYKELEDRGGRRCALGTIIGDVKNLNLVYRPYEIIESRYHIMISLVKPPFQPYSTKEDRVIAIIFILNDEFRWTRPQIAEWLRNVEDEYGEIGPQLPTKEGEHAVCNDHVTISSERL